MQAAYWLSFFTVTILWGTGCIALGGYSRPGSTNRAIRSLQTFASIWGIVAWLTLPWFCPVPWWSPLPILALGVAAGALVSRIAPRGSRYSSQLRNAVSWFLMALGYALVGLLGGAGIWLIGATIFLMAAIWNAFSDFHIKPAMQEFYSKFDDATLWSGPMLPEEFPSLAMLLPAFFFWPWPTGSVDGRWLADLFQKCSVPLAVMLTGFILGSIFSSQVIRNELRRVAMARLFRGLTGLVILLLVTGFLASLRAGDVLHIDAAYWLASGTAGPGRAMELLTVCLWTASASLLIGLAPTLMVVVSIPARPPEHHVFLSFCTLDRVQAEELSGLSKMRGLRLFYSDEAILAGELYRNQIRKAVRNSLEMMVLATPRSVERDWVRNEWALALAMEKRVVPVLDELAPPDLPDVLRDRQVVKFEDADDYLAELVQRLRSRRSLLGSSTLNLGEEKSSWPPK
jgi:hypothetical protein